VVISKADHTQQYRNELLTKTTELMSIDRRLPKSNITRQNALIKASERQASVMPGNEVLSATTATRLANMMSNYDHAIRDVSLAQGNLSLNTPDKDKALQEAKTFNSHFIQVFNLGVARGKYPAAHRSFYQLEVGSSAVPPMESEADILNWGTRLINGDALRLGAGGAPMANPDITEVQTAHSAASTLSSDQADLKGKLDNAQEKLNKLNIDADSLIKRIWDEVETYYGEEAPPSMRANARLWGVIYTSSGPVATLTGLVKDPAGNPRVGAEVELLQSSAKATTNADGRYTLETTLTGEATIMATWPGLPPTETTVEIPEHEAAITIEVPELVVG
jgi:hypothetical protein